MKLPSRLAARRFFRRIFPKVICSDYISLVLALLIIFSAAGEDAPLFRLEVTPSPENSLEKACQIMVDKIATIRKDKVRQVIGRLDEDTILRIDRSLAFWLGLG